MKGKLGQRGLNFMKSGVKILTALLDFVRGLSGNWFKVLESEIPFFFNKYDIS